MDISAKEYFMNRRHDSDPMRAMYSRIANAMHIHVPGGISMNRLCRMTEKELKRVRGIGEKARAVIIEECRNYLHTRGN